MTQHCFNFEGGEYLTTIGASWFTSYAYYIHIDKTHKNWNLVSTYNSRISVFTRTVSYHKFWLNQILEMSENKLRKNTILLTPSQIKSMAEEILNKWK